MAKTIISMVTSLALNNKLEAAQLATSDTKFTTENRGGPVLRLTNRILLEKKEAIYMPKIKVQIGNLSFIPFTLCSM